MKNKKAYLTYIILIIFSLITAYLFVSNKQGRELVGRFVNNSTNLSKFDNKLDKLNALLIKEEEHNEKLIKARYWCAVGKERIYKRRQMLENRIISLNKNSINYQKKKASIKKEFNLISDIPYWDTCEKDFQARLDKSSHIIDSLNNDINNIMQESIFSNP